MLARGEEDDPTTDRSNPGWQLNDHVWTGAASDLTLTESLQLIVAVQNLARPCQFVIDTEFFYSAFQYELLEGRSPLSLREAMNGSIRLYMASSTMLELKEKKIDEFAIGLRASPSDLSEMLQRWQSWITQVDVPAEHRDPRIAAVSERDPSDRPAAILASMLAPCILVTNDKDFQAYGVNNSISHVIVFKAAVELSWASVEMHAILQLPELPLRAATVGVGWVAERFKVSPLVVIATIALLGFAAYRVVSDETRSSLKTMAKSVATSYVNNVQRVQVAERLARACLEQRVVVPAAVQSREDRIIRELAKLNEPISAQRLWETLQPIDRPGVASVREILRSHPSATPCGRGTWTFGSGLPS
jgi:hypothetical protein